MGLMRRVSLQDRDGNLLAVGEIPESPERPDVLFWDQRVFGLQLEETERVEIDAYQELSSSVVVEAIPADQL